MVERRDGQSWLRDDDDDDDDCCYLDVQFISIGIYHWELVTIDDLDMFNKVTYVSTGSKSRRNE